MTQLSSERSTWLAVTVGLLLLAAPACKSESGQKGDEKQAESVEADKKAQKSGKPGDEGAKEGAAAEKPSDSKDKAQEQAVVGEAAPDFTLTDATGEEHSLSDYQGKIVVLEWTSPECPYVKRHYKAETMSETHEAVGEKDVVWLSIDSSHFNKPKDSKAFKKKYGFDHPVLQDPKGEVGRMYGAKTTPHMYVIDEEGVLRYQGAIDDDKAGRKDDPTNYVKQAVEALKAGETIEKKSTKPYGCSVKYKG